MRSNKIVTIKGIKPIGGALMQRRANFDTKNN